MRTPRNSPGDFVGGNGLMGEVAYAYWEEERKTWVYVLKYGGGQLTDEEIDAYCVADIDREWKPVRHFNDGDPVRREQ